MPRPDPRRRRAGRAGLLLALLLAPLSTPPARAADDEDAARRNLKSVEGDIAKADARRRALEAEAAAIAGERADLQRRAVETASRVRAAEDAVASAEGRLAELSAAAAARGGDLEARRAELSRLLAGLERLARQPAAAPLLRPGTPVDTIRGGILLGAAVPGLSDEARRLVAEIAEIERLRAAVADERTRLVGARDALSRTREDLAKLMDERRQAEAASRATLATEKKRLADLVADARDLKALIAAAEEARRAREAAAREAAERAAAEAEAAANSGGGRTGSAGEAARLRAAILVPPPAPKAKPGDPSPGLLPVRGRVVSRFGATDAEGLTSRGVRIATRASSEVVSPVAGQIVFSGPFKGYGQLLIVSAGGGYHLLLAGMGRIDGTIGQRVVAGEPVGQMGDGDGGEPALYIELRREGEPVDPLPWIGAGGRGSG